MFEHALTSDGNARRSAATFVVSLFIQGGVIAALVIVPLMATDRLPVPENVLTFMEPPPPPRPPPPPPLPPKARPGSVVRRPMLTATHSFLVPVEIPSEIGMDDLGLDLSVIGVGGGVPDGVIGGICGCLPEEPLPPQPQEPVRVGGIVRPPSKTRDVAPIYPEIAKQARVEGIVILEAIIDPAGNVTHVRVLRSRPLLDESAIDAVKQWKYEPTLLNGVPVPIVMTVTVTFQLSN